MSLSSSKVFFLIYHIINGNLRSITRSLTLKTLCRDKLLVIEVDGGYHSERTQQEDDAVRQQWLESIGYKVIRFSNEEVLFNLDKTINTIMFNLLGSVPPPKQGE